MYTDTPSPLTTTQAPPTADVVIVGGGIAGVSLASELGGRARVVVLEAEPALFRHTSSRSAQQVQPSYGAPPVRQLTRTTLDLLRSVPEPILSPRPLYVLDLGDSTDPHERGEGLRDASPAEVEAAFPALRRGIVQSAAADDDANEVRVPALLEHYARQAAARGVEFVSGARVTGARRVGSDWRLETTAGPITTPIVVNAAGSWAEDLASVFGARSRELQPMRRTVILSTPTGTPVGADWPMIYDGAGSVYFRARGAEVLASPLEDEPSAPEDARPRADIVARTIARVNELTTFDLETAQESWTGLRTVASDDMPVIGYDSATPGFYWLAGQGGYGIQTSMAIAMLAAADVLGEAGPLGAEDQFAFAQLRADRFD